MVEKSALHRSHRPGGLPLLVAHYALRLLQFICSLATIIIWGSDIQSLRNNHITVHSDYVFSVIIASLTLVVCIVFMIPHIISWRFFFVDAVLGGVGWLIVFAIWAKNYFPRNCTSGDCEQLKMSGWFSLVAWLAWLITAVVGFILFNRDRKYTHAGSWMATIRGGRSSSGYPHSNA